MFIPVFAIVYGAAIRRPQQERQEPSQTEIKDFCQLSQRESQGRCKRQRVGRQCGRECRAKKNPLGGKAKGAFDQVWFQGFSESFSGLVKRLGFRMMRRGGRLGAFFSFS